MSERRGLAQSVVGFGTRALDSLRVIPYHNWQIESVTELLDKVLTSAFLLCAINHPSPDKPARMINGQGFTLRGLASEVSEGTEIGRLVLEVLRKRAKKKGVVWVVQMLNPGQNAPELIKEWQTE